MKKINHAMLNSIITNQELKHENRRLKRKIKMLEQQLSSLKLNEKRLTQDLIDITKCRCHV